MRRVHWIIILLTAILTGYAGGGPRAATDQPEPAGATGNPPTGIGLKIDRYLSAMASLGFSGAIIVEHGGEVVLRKGYGLADREARRPYTPETVQTHGSITKQMTAAAILLLESRGALSVEDSIAQYVEAVPRDKRAITLHQLLTHSSGLPGGIGPDEEPIDGATYVERLMAEPLGFKPGSEYAYSNAGYTLLGLIVERVSGQDYETFLRKALLRPAGMHATGYVLPGWEDQRLALGYHKGELWGVVRGRGWLDDGPGWHLRANGGLHTTVDDMHRWLETVRGRGVLDAEAARRWTTGYVDEGYGNSRYGYGWEVQDSEWGPMIAHSGSNRIFSADFVWLPEREVFVYIQGNTSTIAAHDQRDPLLSAAFDDGFLMPPLVEPDGEARPQNARDRVGTYRLEGGSLELSTDDTRLVARISGQGALDLMFDHSEEQRGRFAELNRRTADAMRNLEAGRADAVAGLVGVDDDPVESTRFFLDRIAQIGNLHSLNLIGSFANVPGSPLAEYGPWTTFVYAKFENWNQYWNIVWNSDGTYRGTASGPWPTFILVPTGEQQYTAIRQGAPWNTVDVRFENGCLVLGDRRACPENQDSTASEPRNGNPDR